MTELICFILSCFGVTNAVTSGKIFEWLRSLLQPIPWLGYMVKCPMCLGFWVGIGWAIVGIGPVIYSDYLAYLLSSGFISSGTCWVFRVILHRLGEDSL